MKWGDPELEGSGIPLPSALAQVLDRQPHGRPATLSLGDQLRTLLDVFGSQRKLAAAMGVDHAQISRWLAGKTRPSKLGAAKLGRVWASVGLPARRKATMGPVRERRFRRPQRFVIDALMRISNDERRRRLQLSDLNLSDATLDAMVDAYLAGNDQGAADAFEDQGLGDDYGVPGMLVVEVYELIWG